MPASARRNIPFRRPSRGHDMHSTLSTVADSAARVVFEGSLKVLCRVDEPFGAVHEALLLLHS